MSEPKRKRMLEVKEEDGRKVVYINSSSLDVINTCKKKSFYLLERNLKSPKVSQAMLFGTAIHKGLEIWYQTKDQDASIDSFKNECGELIALHEKDKRHPNNGIKILQNYFQTYKDDPFEIYRDEKGPVVERDFEITLPGTIGGDKITMVLFGRIDCIMRNRDTGEIIVCDHKTTSSLGVEFYNRIRPNHQYTTYLYAAREAMGLDTNKFLVNGIQVAKTKWDLARQFTERSKEDYDDLVNVYAYAVKEYLYCKEKNLWPMTAPNPCAMWGGCQYRSICEVPDAVREDLISNTYTGVENA